MLNIFFKLFKKQFIKFLNKENGIKLTVNNLLFAFADLEGNSYYKFSKEMELPISRTAKIQEFMMWLVKGVSKEEYLKLIDIAEIAINNGFKDGKGMSKMGFVLHELKDRCNMVLHDELFYNIIAAQYIRHDESPTEFSNDIHMQKVDAIKSMDLNDDAFFLAIQESLAQLNLLNISKEQLKALLNESFIRRMAIIKMENSRLVESSDQ